MRFLPSLRNRSPTPSLNDSDSETSSIVIPDHLWVSPMPIIGQTTYYTISKLAQLYGWERTRYTPLNPNDQHPPHLTEPLGDNVTGSTEEVERACTDPFPPDPDVPEYHLPAPGPFEHTRMATIPKCEHVVTLVADYLGPGELQRLPQYVLTRPPPRPLKTGQTICLVSADGTRLENPSEIQGVQAFYDHAVSFWASADISDLTNAFAIVSSEDWTSLTWREKIARRFLPGPKLDILHIPCDDATASEDGILMSEDRHLPFDEL
ncbi:hypothetical protein BDW22DRAFT_1466283 [Trametopsis cervina]|nr:hypothetical protein BDW22DRAFT_1466283 [Trametopsis cervina]